jgi:hypothetical protein
MRFESDQDWRDWRDGPHGDQVSVMCAQCHEPFAVSRRGSYPEGHVVCAQCDYDNYWSRHSGELVRTRRGRG